MLFPLLHSGAIHQAQGFTDPHGGPKTWIGRRMVLILITGFVILLMMPKRRISGLGVAAIGLALVWVIYLAWVP